MSYRPKIKTDTSGNTQDFGLDADTVDGKHASDLQDKLVSGTNIKTINGNSVLGSGDLSITAKSLLSYSAGGTDDITALQDAFNYIDKSVGTAVRLEHGSAYMSFGYALSGYNYEHAYGSFLVLGYGLTNPTYVRMNNGTWTSSSLALTSDIPDVSGKLDKAGGEMTGTLAMKGTDFELKTSGSSSNDSGDIVFRYGNGNEKARIWSDNTYTASSGRLNYRVYNENGIELMSSTIPSLSDIPSASSMSSVGRYPGSGGASDTTSYVTPSVLYYWNGANTGTSSNLAYCNKGAFGTVVTYDYNRFVASKGAKPTNANKLIDNGIYTTNPNTWDSANDPAPAYNYGSLISFNDGNSQSQFYISDQADNFYIRNNWNTSSTSGSAGTWKKIAFTTDIPSGGMLWNNGSTTWVANNNITCSASSGEFSFDVTDNTGNESVYWHVWSGNLNNSMIQCYPSSGRVNIPYTLTVGGRLTMNGNRIQLGTIATTLLESRGTLESDTARTLPTYGGQPIVMQTAQGRTGDIGALWITEDNAFICNSSDNGYTFCVFDTDLTTDFSDSIKSSFGVRSNGAGIDFRGTMRKVDGSSTAYTYTFPNKSGTIATINDVPVVYNPTITFTQGGTTKGSITLNQTSNQTIALDGGGGATRTLLWENGNTNQRFGYQTVNLSDNISNYDYLLFEFYQGKGTSGTQGTIRVCQMIVAETGDFGMYTITSSGYDSTLYYANRKVYVFSSSVRFVDAYYGYSTSTSGGGSENWCLLPVRIYGIKF